MHNYYFSNEFRAPHKVWIQGKTILNGKLPSLEEIRKIRILPEFDELTTLGNNRLIMAAFRYSIKHDPINYNCRELIRRRLLLYENTNNIEHLVDCFNYIRLEYLRAKILGFKFKSIDDGEHAKPIN